MNIFPKNIKTNRGMTYVELIVVLSIFVVITSITLFNYRKFNDKVNVKTLANDIALKFVEAQKNSASGKLNTRNTNPTWKPSYGLYFQPNSPKSFFSMIDLDNDKAYGGSILCMGGTECLNRINIGNNLSVSEVRVVYTNAAFTIFAGGSGLSVTYTRPSSIATFSSITPFAGVVSYAQITVTSPQGVTAVVKIYASGRIQIN